MELATDLPGEAGAIEELRQRLRHLETSVVTTLEEGLQAMAAGDFTRRGDVEFEPIADGSDDPRVRGITDTFNSVGARLVQAVAAYETLRIDLATALGDRSCLAELLVALRSLDAHCLTDLDRGLQAMADGDLTISAHPVTRPLRVGQTDALGELGEVFNEMLARSRTAVRSYDTVREDLRRSLGDRSALDDLRSGLIGLQRHCLRDLEEALEAVAGGTALTRPIAPATEPIVAADGADAGELALHFNRALGRARAAVEHLIALEDVAR